MHRIRIVVAAALATTLLAACHRDDAAAARERAVYRAVLAAEYPRHQPWRLAVRDSTVTPQRRAGWWRLDTPADSARAAFEGVPREPSSQLRFPISVGYYSRGEVKSLKDGLFGRLGLIARNGSPYVVSVSPVVYSPDSARALVYFEFQCIGEGLCGGGTVYLLARDSASAWRVRNHMMVWVS